MATETASKVSAISDFTNGMSLSEYSDSSDFIPEPHRHPRREIARHKQTLSTAEIRRALLYGSTPIQGDFDPRLGPIGSGRPKSSTAGKDSRKQARRHKVYPWGDMSNLRPEDRGMDPATCLKFYRMSKASGEQEPPITGTTDSSDSNASTTKRSLSTSEYCSPPHQPMREKSRSEPEPVTSTKMRHCPS